jgi:superfamily II DNA or RNA helicase
MAASFNAVGVPSAHIDGTTPDAERDRVIRDFSNGVIKVLTNVDLVSEGFNVCGIQALFLCRPTQSLGLYLQQIGRGLRPSADKDVCMIFDHCSGSSRHGFPDDERIWDLRGVKKRKKSESEQTLSRTCPNCFETHPLHVRICPCGYQLVMEREVEVDADAQLVEIDPAVARRQRLMEQGKADSLEKLIQLGKSKGYKYPDQWARFIFKAREEKKAAKERQLREREGLSPKQAEFYAGFSDLGALEAPDPWAF